MKRTPHRLLGPALTAALIVAAGASLAQQTQGQKDALKAATDRLNAVKAATGAKPTAQRMPPGDPCTVVTLASVQAVIPAVKVAERSTRLESDFGILECQWKSGSGDVLMVVQDQYDRGKSAREDAKGMADLFTAMKGGQNVRIETFPGIGVDNAAYAEVADPARNIPNGGAYVGVRKADREITLVAPGFANKDRAQALKGLEAWAKQAASRL